MTTEEQALCNGITFSVSKLVPNLVQEGEQEGASYYAHVLLTPMRNMLNIKIWNAPFYTPIQLRETAVDSFTVQVESLGSDENDASPYGYCYGGTRGHEAYSVWYSRFAEDIFCMSFRSYSGLMIYPAVKCIIVDIIKDVDRINRIRK